MRLKDDQRVALTCRGVKEGCGRLFSRALAAVGSGGGGPDERRRGCGAFGRLTLCNTAAYREGGGGLMCVGGGG